jgi:hypothetical protein
MSLIDDLTSIQDNEDEAEQWLTEDEKSPKAINSKTIHDESSEYVERYIQKMNHWQNLEYYLSSEQQQRAELEINNLIRNMELQATNNKSYIKKVSGYLAQGDTALLPSQLRALRAKLLSSN